MKNIDTMSQKEIMSYAGEMGAKSNESLEDSATRFEHQGDEGKAKLLHDMAFRWWALEGEGELKEPHRPRKVFSQ